MQNINTPLASRAMLVNSATVQWPTDQTSPFEETAGAYTVATRTLSANNNPPGATPFTAAAAVAGGWIHVGSSTGSVFRPGDYEIESRTSDTAVVLKADSRLPTADVAAVSGYVHPIANNGIAGGTTVVAAQKACSFMADAQAVIVDGARIVASDGTGRSIVLYAHDGTTVLDTIPTAINAVIGSYVAIGGPGGGGYIGGGLSAKTDAVLSVLISFRPATPSEIAGMTRRGT